MKFKYVALGATPPQETTIFGYTFQLAGDAVEVTDAHAIKKLQGNPHFKAVTDGKGPVAKAPVPETPPVDQEPKTVQEPAPAPVQTKKKKAAA